MIFLKNIRTLEGKTTDLRVESRQEFQFDAEGTLTQLPALIDPFANPSEDLESVLKGGITTLLALPDTAEQSHPHLHIRRFLDETCDPFEIGKMKKQAIGLWIEAAHLDAEQKETLDRFFQIAAQEEFPIVASLGNERIKAMQAILRLVEKYNGDIVFTDLFAHDELSAVQNAKKNELMVYGATTLDRLCKPGSESLWEAIQDGTIEIVGGGATPHSLMLPLLLNSFHERKISLEKIVALTRRNIEEVFRLKPNSDLVFVHLDKILTASTGQILHGWPVYTLVDGELFRN